MSHLVCGSGRAQGSDTIRSEFVMIGLAELVLGSHVVPFLVLPHKMTREDLNCAKLGSDSVLGRGGLLISLMYSGPVTFGVYNVVSAPRIRI